MSEPTLAAAVPVTGELIVNGKAFACAAIHVTLTAHAVNVARCSLSVGVGSNGKTVRITENDFPHNAVAQVVANCGQAVKDPVSGAVLIKSGKTVILSGRVEDAGPGTFYKGGFTFDVLVFGEMSVANNGSLQLSYLTPGSIAEMRADVTLLGAQVTGRINTALGPDWGNGEMWASLVEAFVKLIDDGYRVGVDANQAVVSKLRSTFGDSNNDDVRKLLEAMQGFLTPEKISQQMANIRAYISMLFQHAHRYEGLMNRIIDMGYEFMFRVVEHGAGVAVVPFSPFLPTDLHKVVAASSLYKIGWARQDVTDYRGGAMISNNLADAVNRHTPRVGVVGEPFKVEGSNRGVVMTIPVPPWGVTRTGAAGDVTKVDVPFAAPYMGPYVRDRTLEMAYRNRTVTAVSPLRFDVGLLSAVQIVYPAVGGVDAGSLFGVVQAIELTIDAVGKQASTTLTVSYARSSGRQKREIDPSFLGHPLWANVYVGGRLDEHPAAGIG